eukprot:Skav211109  [mRNA]  locus=scaffold3323:105520:110536:- [translate_table: standard]
MWVVKVGHVLAMAGQLPSHQILKAKGLLERWVPTMFTIFVSHQWFGHNHPDPNGVKLEVLQGRPLVSSCFCRWRCFVGHSSSSSSSSDSENTLKTAQLLLESRANINQVCQPEGMCRSIELMCRAYSQFCSVKGVEAGAAVNWVANISTTPLGWCVILENEGLVTFLFRARADPEIRNNRGLRPIDFARFDRIGAVLKDPSPSMYLLEHDSELVTHGF